MTRTTFFPARLFVAILCLTMLAARPVPAQRGTPPGQDPFAIPATDEGIPAIEETIANGAQGKPALPRNCFSRARFWQMWSTRGAGCVGRWAAARSAAATGTFSNS